MADTAKRLAGPVAVGTTAATVYTVPASTVSIVRGVQVANTGASELQFTLGINGTAAANRLWSDAKIPSGGVLVWAGFLVLDAADTLDAIADATGLTLTVSGVEET